MRLQIIDPSVSNKPLSKKDAVAAVRNSFVLTKLRGLTIVHRNQLNKIIDAWLIKNQFQTPTSSGEKNFGLSMVDEVLGTGESSTLSFVRAGLVLKAGPWYCPYPTRGFILNNTQENKKIAILSPFSAGLIQEENSNNESFFLEEAGLVFIGNFNQENIPFPLVNPLHIINLKTIEPYTNVKEAAINFLSIKLQSSENSMLSNPIVQGKTDLTYLPLNDLKSHVLIFSLGRWESLLNVVHNRPPYLWGGIEIQPNVIAVFGQSSYDEYAEIRYKRKVVILITPGKEGTGSPARIIQLNLNPFLAGRIEWAFLAALGKQVIISAKPINESWTLLDFHNVIPTGPLRTWLTLFCSISDNYDKEWMIHNEAIELTRMILSQYFAIMEEKTT
jgi:hypothetical protein